MTRHTLLMHLCGACLAIACQTPGEPRPLSRAPGPTLKPVVMTAPLGEDLDDPAIWIHPTDPAQSLVLGTDKADEDGHLFVFDLQGALVPDRSVGGLRRPNNVDVEQDVALGDARLDIAVVTERGADAIRVFRLPDMVAIDGGGLPVFEGEAQRQPMGVGLYRRPSDGVCFAIVSRKKGPREGYLAQYRLEDRGDGRVRAVKVRAFGRFSGVKEIEAVVVDDALGYVYYADEGVGIHKYHADPVQGDRALALIGRGAVQGDHEGLSMFRRPDGSGYLIVSDQQAHQLQVFARRGPPGSLHQHAHLATIPIAARFSDGSEVSAHALGAPFEDGLFVAMSDDRRFHYYRWRDLAARIDQQRKAMVDSQQ